MRDTADLDFARHRSRVLHAWRVRGREAAAHTAETDGASHAGDPHSSGDGVDIERHAGRHGDGVVHIDAVAPRPRLRVFRSNLDSRRPLVDDDVHPIAQVAAAAPALDRVDRHFVAWRNRHRDVP